MVCLVYFGMENLVIFRPLGIFCGYLASLWLFGIFLSIWYIYGHLVYLWTFGIIMDILVYLKTWYI
jgi:hypothetical protein